MVNREGGKARINAGELTLGSGKWPKQTSNSLGGIASEEAQGNEVFSCGSSGGDCESGKPNVDAGEPESWSSDQCQPAPMCREGIVREGAPENKVFCTGVKTWIVRAERRIPTQEDLRSGETSNPNQSPSVPDESRAREGRKTRVSSVGESVSCERKKANIETGELTSWSCKRPGPISTHIRGIAGKGGQEQYCRFRRRKIVGDRKSCRAPRVVFWHPVAARDV